MLIDIEERTSIGLLVENTFVGIEKAWIQRTACMRRGMIAIMVRIWFKKDK